MEKKHAFPTSHENCGEKQPSLRGCREKRFMLEKKNKGNTRELIFFLIGLWKEFRSWGKMEAQR
jgi:hypothetical protein